MLAYLPELPVTQVLPELRHALTRQNHAILSAPPGSGKTTLVPLALMDEPWLQGQRILLLEPRRLAARLCAERMAQLLDEPLGKRVGYRIRQERRVSSTTRIEVVTEGILTRQIQQDPELKGVGLLIFDEFHERSLQTDLGLALALDVMGALREDLRLLIMSATLDSQALADFLGDAAQIEAQGRSHPVEVHYQDRPSDQLPVTQALRGVLRALREQSGDLLVFLPGTGEIRRLQQVLSEQLGPEVLICPLYADLDRAGQTLALTPDAQGRRRIVLATTVAETSLTIEGIHTVVDLGLARQPHFDPNSGLSRLVTVRCSAAATDQRAGRAGRLGPGHCYRLWSASQQSQLVPATAAEMLQSDLAPLVLELARWGASPDDLRWLDPPPRGAWQQGVDLLVRLGLLDGRGQITAAGQRVSDFGIHPRLGAMLLTGERTGQGRLAADLAAILSERDLMTGSQRPVDIGLRLKLLAECRDRRQGGPCRRLLQLSRRWLKGLRSGESADLTPGGLLLAAFPDRLAQLKDQRGLRYKLAQGPSATLPEGDALTGSPYLVVTNLDAGRREGRIFMAAAVTEAEIRAVLTEGIEIRRQVQCQAGLVRAMEQQCYATLVLSERPLADPDPQSVQQALLATLVEQGLSVLNWSKAAQVLRQRLIFLRLWQPDAGWPDLSDEALLSSLENWLGPWVSGMNRLQQLAGLDLTEVLRALLSWPQQQALETLAPSHLSVPSGSSKALDYTDPTAPVLAVKLQELFGLLETPRICAHQVPLTLHLLSPARRPVQVTQDLEGFWQNTYQDVKKELKGRYPKHYWPDDPFTAIATARVRPVQ